MNLLSKQGNATNETREVVCSNDVQSTSLYLSTINHNTWIIDSGASDHMCYNLLLFDDYKTLTVNNHYVIITNGNQVKVNIIGNIIISY